MATATANRSRASKVKLASGKMTTRVVSNIEDTFDGYFQGTISLKGESVTVRRKKHSRSWQVVA